MLFGRERRAFSSQHTGDVSLQKGRRMNRPSGAQLPKLADIETTRQMRANSLLDNKSLKRSLLSPLKQLKHRASASATVQEGTAQEIKDSSLELAHSQANLQTPRTSRVQETLSSDQTLSGEKQSTVETSSPSLPRQENSSTARERLIQVEEQSGSADFDLGSRKKTIDENLSLEQRSQRFAQHFDSLRQRNMRYFEHLRGECRCGRCQCVNQKCRCIVRGLLEAHQTRYETQYAKQFKGSADLINQTSPLTVGLQASAPLRQFRPIENTLAIRSSAQQAFEDITVSQAAFAPKTGRRPYEEVVEVKRDTLQAPGVPISTSTSYSSAFNNKFIPQNVLFAPVANIPSATGLKLFGTSKNRQEQLRSANLLHSKVSHINWARERDRNLSPPVFLDHVPAATLGAGQSNYRATHTQLAFFGSIDQGATLRSHHLKLDMPVVRENRQRTSQSTFHFKIDPVEGQFLSTKQRDYAPRVIPACSATIEQADDIPRLPRNTYYFNKKH